MFCFSLPDQLGRALLLALLMLSVGALPSSGQTPDSDSMLYDPEAPEDQTVTLTLEDAIRVALMRNYQLRNNRLDVENAEAQIRQAWGQLYPQLSASSNYTRNVLSANPFAGSDVTGLFGGGNATDWVAFNERARQDDDPSTEPITFQAFQRRQQEAREAVGIQPGIGGNPFAVDNQFSGGFSVEQTLFNRSAFAAVRGARQLEDVNQLGVDRQAQVVIDSVRSAFYGALLAQEQARIAEQSVERTQATFREVSRRVEQGVTPKYQRLSTEVELANLRTQLVQAHNRAALAQEGLKLTLGLPMDQPIELAGELEVENPGELLDLSTEEALTMAFENRPDLEQARLAVELREIEKNTIRAEYFPTLSAVADFSYAGRVPDTRSQTLSDPTDPFAFSVEDRGFFSTDFWDPSVSVGLQLTWNIFDGFQREARLEQQEVVVNRAELQREQQEAFVHLEIEQALQNLRAAHQRLQAQEQNVETAELNYQYTNQRLQNGVSTQLELREASTQLDESRFNYLQAVYDYLTARSALERATGVPLTEDSAFRLVQPNP